MQPVLQQRFSFSLRQVSSGVLSGILNISPEKIQAVDMDSINAPIHYSFLSGNPPNYRDFFEINPNTGAVKQIKAVDTTVTKKFDIIIKVNINIMFLRHVKKIFLIKLWIISNYFLNVDDKNINSIKNYYLYYYK